MHVRDPNSFPCFNQSIHLLFHLMASIVIVNQHFNDAGKEPIVVLFNCFVLTMRILTTDILKALKLQNTRIGSSILPDLM